MEEINLFNHCPQQIPILCAYIHRVNRPSPHNEFRRTEKNLSSQDLVTPVLVGTRKASTFTGFCSFHDNVTFKPVEKFPFGATPEQIFLLSYRALCHEYFKKKMIIELVIPYQQRHLDRGRTQEEQLQIQYYLRYLVQGDRVGLRDLAFYKEAYDRALLAEDFSKVSYYVIQLDNVPDFLCTAPHMPDYDFTGKRTLQNIRDTSIIVDHLTYSLIATDTGGAAVFSWLGKSEAARLFVQSLDALPDHEIPQALTRFTFQYFENIFVSPTWWDSLDAPVQQSLLNRQRAGTPHQPDPTAACLVNDSIQAVNWRISSRNIHLAC